MVPRSPPHPKPAATKTMTTPQHKPKRKPPKRIINPYRRQSPSRITAHHIAPTPTPTKGTPTHNTFNHHKSAQTKLQKLTPDSEYPDFPMAILDKDSYRKQFLQKLTIIAATNALDHTTLTDIAHMLTAWQATHGDAPIMFQPNDIEQAIRTIPTERELLATVTTVPTMATVTPTKGERPIEIFDADEAPTEDPVHPNPIIDPTCYKRPTTDKTTPHDTVASFKNHMQTHYHLSNIQTPLNFAAFGRHHAAVNAIIAGLAAFNTPPSVIEHLTRTSRAKLPRDYAIHHPNKFINPTPLPSNLLPPHYTIVKINNLQWADLLVPKACTKTIPNHDTNIIAFPIIVESKIKPLALAEADVGYMSEFAVVHTMANALVIGSARTGEQSAHPDARKFAYQWFKLGSQLGQKLQAADNPAKYVSRKLGSKLFPYWDAKEPTQNHSRDDLEIIGAYALLPPNPTPTALDQKTTSRKRKP